MLKVLMPVDGSDNSLQAVRHVLNRYFDDSRMEIHLLHVRRPFSMHVAKFSSNTSREHYHREMAGRALQPSRKLLNRHHAPYAVHIELGDKAKTIDRLAQRLHVDEIVMGASRRNSLTRLLEDSVTNRVLQIVHVPVKLIAGMEVSKLEKYGVPTAGGTALAALLVAAVD